MKEKLSVEFKNKCFKDIEEIYGEIEDYVPELPSWQMHQSVVLGEDCKLLCRAILDDDSSIIGYQVNLDVLKGDICKYRLTILENSLEFTKDYSVNGDMIRELYKTELDGAVVNRMCIYEKNQKYLKYDESHDSNLEFNKWDSYAEISGALKNSLETRKARVRER